MNNRLAQLAADTMLERALYATEITQFVKQCDMANIRREMLPAPTSPTLWMLSKTDDGLWLLGNAIAAGILTGAYSRFQYKPANNTIEVFHLNILQTALVIDDDISGALAACGLPIFERRRRAA